MFVRCSNGSTSTSAIVLPLLYGIVCPDVQTQTDMQTNHKRTDTYIFPFNS